jgi:hypothetical protein
MDKPRDEREAMGDTSDGALAVPSPIPEACDDLPLGLICHRCGCCHFYVVYTRKRPDGRILRRRECRHCGHRIMTIEKEIS